MNIGTTTGDYCGDYHEGKIEPGNSILGMEEEQEEDNDMLGLGVNNSDHHGILVQEIDVDHMRILIQAVEERPILYASVPRGTGKEHNLIKENAWKEVSYIVGKEVVWCTKKWKSLRDTFVKKVNSLRGKNSSVRRKIQSWTYFSSLAFLSDYIHHQSTATKKRIAQHREETAYTKQQGMMQNLVTTADFLEIGIHEETPRAMTMTPTSSSNSNSNSMTRIINSLNGMNQSPQISTATLTKRERERDSFVEDGSSQELWGKKSCVVEMATTTTQKKTLDVHDYFCMSLAQQMRNFPSAHSSEARMKISQIMFEIESRSD